jgi:hypothetical protein
MEVKNSRQKPAHFSNTSNLFNGAKIMTIRTNLLIGLSASMTFLVCPCGYAETEVDITNPQVEVTSPQVEGTNSQVNDDTATPPPAAPKRKKYKSKRFLSGNFLRKHKKVYVNQALPKDLLGPDAEALETQKAASFGLKKAPLHGSLTCVNLSAGFGQGISVLALSALKQQPRYMEATRAVKHYSTKVQRTIRFAKDAVNYAIPYRGFSMSIEASKVVLNKDQKLNNLCIAELTQQKYIDEMHSKIMVRAMQIAVGVGIQDPAASQREVDKGVNELAKLVGKEQAQYLKDELVAWNDQLTVSDSAFQQQPWDVDTSARIYQHALDRAEDGDPLIDDVCKRAKKFIHGKFFNATAGAVESTLSGMTIMSGNPLISIGAEAANTAFVMATGGPEENKILKDIYFGRRMEIRRKRISDEVQLALSNYEKAQFTHNKAQLAISEIVLGQVVGPDALAEILERDPVNDIEHSAPVELAKLEAK